jgi:ferritin-like metal-binding protein YciE
MKTNTKTLTELFINELSDIYDAEHRISKALPKMIKAATCSELKSAILKHLEETEGHITKVEQVFACFNTKAKKKTCKATIGLLEEGENLVEEFKGSCARDAAIISALQKVEHYEMTSYGCLHAWAGLLENSKAENILGIILSEEKAANQCITEIAIASVNQKALCECDDEDCNDTDDRKTKTISKTTSVTSTNKKRPVAY